MRLTRVPSPRGRRWLLPLRGSCRRLCRQRAEQLGVVVGGLGLRAHRGVDHLGVLADQDPPGAGSHSVEDDGRRLCRAERRLVPEIGN